MKNNNNQSQRGSISMFVMIAMVFFLITILGVYMVYSKRAQTQTESVGMTKEKYYTEGEENEKYDIKIASDTNTIPIYTKEQLWSIGENKAIEIEGKVYDFSTTDLSQYELKNDIVINIETDLANLNFKDNFVFGDNTIEKNEFDVSYYYNGDYYVPINYSGTKLSEGTAVLSASGNDFSTISTLTSGLTGKYYLFTYKNLSEDLGYVTDGLMLHYDGIKNTATGHKSDVTTWKDLSGSGNEGILNGCIWEEDDLSFDGIDDWVGVGQMNYSNVTLEIVVENTEIKNENTCYIGNWETGGYGIFLRENGKNVMEAYIDASYQQQETEPIVANVKYSLSGSYDNSALRIFLNGIKNEKDMKGNIGYPINNTILVLGANPSDNSVTGSYLKGKIYSIRVYNRALTDAEVQQNYEIDKVRFHIE